MQLKRKASSKTFPSCNAFLPDQTSLDMKVLSATYVAHCMVNCLNNEYVPLYQSKFGWAFVNDTWKPVWFKGNALPEVNKTVDSPENESSEDEEDMIDEVDEGEISDDSDFVESSDDLSENDSLDF